MVAVVALHDAAELTGLECERCVQKLLNKAGLGIHQISGGRGPAGVLAVLLHKLVEKGFHVPGGLELGQQVLRQGLFGLDLLLAEALPGGAVLGGKKDVVHIGVVIRGRCVKLAGGVRGHRLQVVQQVSGGGDAVIGLLADADFHQPLLECLLAAGLLDLLGQVLLHGGLVLVGEGHAALLRQVLHHHIGQDVALGAVFGVLAGRGVVHGAVPVDGPVLTDDVGVSEVIHVEHIFRVGAGVAQPVEIHLRRDRDAVILQHRLLGLDTGDVVIDALGGDQAVRAGRAVIVVSAARADGQQEQQGHEPAQVFFHVTFPFRHCFYHSQHLPGTDMGLSYHGFC